MTELRCGRYPRRRQPLWPSSRWTWGARAHTELAISLGPAAPREAVCQALNTRPGGSGRPAAVRLRGLPQRPGRGDLALFCFRLHFTRPSGGQRELGAGMRWVQQAHVGRETSGKCPVWRRINLTGTRAQKCRRRGEGRSWGSPPRRETRSGLFEALGLRGAVSGGGRPARGHASCSLAACPRTEKGRGTRALRTGEHGVYLKRHCA